MTKQEFYMDLTVTEAFNLLAFVPKEAQDAFLEILDDVI